MGTKPKSPLNLNELNLNLFKNTFPNNSENTTRNNGNKNIA